MENAAERSDGQPIGLLKQGRRFAEQLGHAGESRGFGFGEAVEANVVGTLPFFRARKLPYSGEEPRAGRLAIILIAREFRTKQLFFADQADDIHGDDE